MALECPKCREKLAIRRTYSAGAAGQAQEAVCLECGRKWVAATVVVREIDQFGIGAFAYSREMLGKK